MGFITTITLHNDAMGEFEKDPAAFGAAILKAMERANYSRKEESAPIGSYANYIDAHPSRHADDHTVYVHKGNLVFNLHYLSKDFKDLASRSPETLKNFINEAQWFVTQAKKELKKYEN